MLKKITLAFFLILTAIVPLTYAENFDEPVRAELIVEEAPIQAGHSFWVGIRLNMDDNWHLYWKNPGDAGMAPHIEWNLPQGFKAGPIQWPTPKRFALNSTIGFGYENEVILLAEITSPQNSPSTVTLKADLQWVACDDASCLPGSETVTVTIPQRTVDHNTKLLFEKARAKIPQPHKNAAAERKDNLLSLKLEAKGNIAKAHFFPENMDKIDHTVETIITKSPDHPNTYNIVLKEAENGNPEAPLQGVVVLMTGEGEEEIPEAYTIDISVPQIRAGEVALLDDIPTVATAQHELEGHFTYALVLAFLGGLILNLMPCVLPVISFKVLSFVKMAGESRTLVFKHGAAFSLGVLLSFWVLAGILLGLQAYGRAVGWGFQLQEPIFVGILAAVIFVFGLSMFGVFELGTGVASAAGQAETGSTSKGLVASFFSGILATAIATPCTGPFLGTAVGFAVTLPAPAAMLMFTTLGLGMASPYLLLGAFPGLLRFIPKPGNWMITFKEIIGFVMVATVLWLVWVFGAQTNAFAIFLLLGSFFFLAIGSWIFGKWGTPIKKKRTRQISYACTLACLLMGGYILVTASSITPLPEQHLTNSEAGGWETFSAERVEELQRQGVPVFVDFTAKWCMICQANHMVLSVDEINNKFNELGVVKMKADLTKNNPEIIKVLSKFGRNSVPLYLLYDGKSENPPTVLPQLLSPDIIIGNLEEMQTKSRRG